MHPFRFSIVSYNIWGEQRFDFRRNALQRFLELFAPDVLCLQEFSPRARALIDATLPGYRRIDDALEGWTSESNIYWRDALFEKIEHGAEEVNILKSQHRRLFWVRLALRGFPSPHPSPRERGARGSSERSILVATAHLTQQRNPEEMKTGQSPRVGETQRIVAALERVRGDSGAVFFMGDFNDPVHPTNVLKDAGYTSSFAALGLQPDSTFKVYPTSGVAPGELAMNQCVDWIVSKGDARVMATSIPRFFHEDAAPSDHWPVLAVYELVTGDE